MAMTKLEIQKKILLDANQRVDGLVSEILSNSEINKEAIDIKSFNSIHTLIKMVENMEFNGNMELLKDTVGVYENAINAIDEQLKSENMEEFGKYSEDSLKEVKKCIEEQLKDGRVGTIFQKVEVLTKEEMSGRLEEEYNNDKIEEYDYDIKQHKAEEDARIEPFNKVMATTRKNREEVEKTQKILNDIEKLNNEKEELEAQLKDPKANAKTINEEIEKIDKGIIQIASTAEENEGDKLYSINPSEKMEDYIARIKAQLSLKSKKYEQGVLKDLETIKDLEVDLGFNKQKVEDYLKEYMSKGKSVYDLTDKLSVDKQLLRKNIKEQKLHQELEELKGKKKNYENRNKTLYEDINKYESKNSDTQNLDSKQDEVQMEVYKKKGRFGKFMDFIKSKIHIGKGNKKAKQNEKNRKSVAKRFLNELEKETKETKKGFDYKYKVEEKDLIEAKARNSINSKRDQYYKKLEEEENEKGR